MAKSESVTARTVGLALIALVALAALLVTALRPKPVLVDVATVARSAMSVTIDEEGRTRVRDVYTVSAPVAGRVLRSALNPGDHVDKGRTIVAVIEETAPMLLDVRARREIESQIAAAQSAVALADAELRRAEAEATFAGREWSRAQQLARTNVIAEKNLERARLELDTKTAQVLRGKAALDVRRRELDLARARLTGPQLNPAEGIRDESACCVSVLSPVSGRVLRRIHDSEKIVASGIPLIEIGDIDDIEIVVDLLSSDAVKVRIGAPASIDSWGGGKPLLAVVNRIEPAGFTKTSALGIEEQRVRVVLDIQTPLAERRGLGHDYRAHARIETWSSPEARTVPLSALFRQATRWAVFVYDNGRARLRTIEIGHRNNVVAEVIEGLEPGDSVLLHPSDKVKDGARVAKRPVSEISNGQQRSSRPLAVLSGG
jgi:HlyD family secretion protein